MGLTVLGHFLATPLPTANYYQLNLVTLRIEKAIDFKLLKNRISYIMIIYKCI